MSCCNANAKQQKCCGPKGGPTEGDNIKDSVKEYYGKRLASTSDLQTNACTLNSSAMPKHIRDALKEVHPEIKKRYYGCGQVIPDGLGGMSVLDLGSGAGQDVYVLAKLVGESGHVTGLDMTDEQLAVANEYKEYHREKFGFSKVNTEFVKGYIEDLKTPGIPDNKFDVIISNCVVNLSPDKTAVIEEAYRVLKVGGELYFSDVYADCDLPETVRKHKVLWGECIAGALYWRDFVKIAKKAGFSQPRIYSSETMDIQNAELEKVVGDAKFTSTTYRLFKLPSELEKTSSVIYKGTLLNKEKEFDFDVSHTFKTDEPVLVNSELATILASSRFKEHFVFKPAEKVQPETEEIDPDPFKIAKK